MTECRFCGTTLEKIFIDLGSTPLANSLVTDESTIEKKFPLKTFICTKCYLVQLEEFEKPEKIFEEYVYFSSFSKSFVNHVEDYVEMITNKLKLNQKSFVVEIASNDGYLLQFFEKKNIPHLGIEPAKNIADESLKRGINTIKEFFGEESAQKIIKNHDKADLIICNNVLAHVPNLKDFIKGLKILLSKTGTITVEFPHLLELIRHNQFDTIYHEHFSYFSFFVINKIFRDFDLVIYDVQKISTHGGSLRIFVKHLENSLSKISSRVENLLLEETNERMKELRMYEEFDAKIKENKKKIWNFFDTCKKNKSKIIGYGAPAKANTLLNYCNISKDMIEFLVDKSPHKQGHFLPGTHIPIKNPKEIREIKPDFLFIFPWNLKEEIIEENEFVREWGGKFVIPVPQLQIIK